MLINLRESKLFTHPPEERFARNYEDVWGEMWERRVQKGYTPRDLCEFYRVRTGQRIPQGVVKRWLWRSEVYHLVEPAMKKGACVVVSSYFGAYEEAVLREITKNISVHPKNKILP